MPGCPPSCPKVKRQLKQLAAERKKAVDENDKEKASKGKGKERQGELDSPDKYFEAKDPEDWIPGEESTSHAGVSEGKSDHISQKRVSDSSISARVSARTRTKGSQEDLEDTISNEERASQGGASEGKSDRISQKRVPESSSSARASVRSRTQGSQVDQEDTISDEERASRGDASVGKSDHISQKHVPDSSSSDRVSVRSGESTKSKDDFKSTKSEKSTRTQEDGIHQKTSSRSGSASRSQQRTPRDSDHEVSGKASKGSRPRDGGNLEHEGSDFGGSDGESRDRSSRKKPGPSTTSSHSERSRTQKRVESDQSEDLELGDFGSDEGFDSSRHNPCSSECSFRRLKEEMMRRKLEDRQKAIDDYLLNCGMSYFEDICTCCSGCFAKQLWNDPFVRKMLLSAALFAVGIKLCWEMDAWYLPT